MLTVIDVKPGAKANGALKLINMVKSYGAPIHGFGMQGHMTTGQVGSAAQYVSNMQAFTALGVEVAYTELDIATPSSNPNFSQQAIDYATIVSACKQVSGCVGITIWGFTDRVSAFLGREWVTRVSPVKVGKADTSGSTPGSETVRLCPGIPTTRRSRRTRASSMRGEVQAPAHRRRRRRQPW